VDDVEIAAALRARNPAGLAAAYDEYADRLVAYCAAMLQDRHAAADAVHDTFVVAYERADQLRDPGKLRSWLYSIARNECLRVLRGQQRTSQLDEAIAVSDDTVELDAGLRDEELRDLVWSAANGLNPREREVLDLAVRHELDMSEVAKALGVPAKHAHALLSKARQQLERAVTVLIVARTGRRDCAELEELLSGWDGGLTVLLRKRVARHIDGCANCSARRRKDVNAEALFAAVPLLLAPLTLRDEILATAGGLEPARAALADRAGLPDSVRRRTATVRHSQGPGSGRPGTHACRRGRRVRSRPGAVGRPDRTSVHRAERAGDARAHRHAHNSGHAHADQRPARRAGATRSARDAGRD
jgi:RNA polymerase sigma factor (sigma-70 family)